ncbi:MAG: leucine-rich repeat domain-containing protein [Patescibacteria group bacterium]
MKIAYLSAIVAMGLLGAGCTADYVGTTNQTNVPNVPTQVNNAKKLDLSNKGLEKIPANIFDQQNLEELNVSNNRLTGAIQAEIRKLKNLRVLNASNNQMTGVPAEVGQLQNLEVLDLSNNQLTGLPNELANLKKLKTLNLSGNKYSAQDLEVIRRALPNVNYIL